MRLLHSDYSFARIGNNRLIDVEAGMGISFGRQSRFYLMPVYAYQRDLNVFRLSVGFTLAGKAKKGA